MALSKNIISEIVIHPQVQNLWMDALADVAVTMQRQKGGSIIKIGVDSAVVNRAGMLEISAFVGGEHVAMEVPGDCWCQKKP